MEKEPKKIALGDTHHGQEVKKHEGIKHAGTDEFANRVRKRQKRAKMAKQSRKGNRGK